MILYYKPEQKNTREKMKVKVNGKELEVFDGAKVRHAVLRYVANEGADLSELKNVVVMDAFGHEIDLDAPLSQNGEIEFKVQ